MGGGNIWRGRFTDEMNPVSADQMGMLATVINALAVQDAILRQGVKATVFTPQEMTRFAEHYRADRAIERMENGEIVLLAGGSGQPLLHHRHRRRAARRGAEGRRGVQGHHRGRRVRLRPAQKPRRASSSGTSAISEAIDRGPAA